MAKDAANKPLTKAQILNELSERTGLSKKDVGSVLEQLEGLISDSLDKKGPGVFTVPGLMKIQIKTRKKQPAKKGINLRTGEEIMIPAKPARRVVRVSALKKLKEMVK